MKKQKDTLNSILRNKVQPLHTTIELMEMYNNSDEKQYEEGIWILNQLLSKENIQLLKDLEDFLIR